MSDAIKVRDITVHYGDQPVLWDINLAIPPGKLVAIVGPNGAGKSTLIKAMLGLIKPVSGSVLFFGKKLGRSKGKVAYIPQRESIDWDFPITVRELVLMGFYPKLGLFGWIKKKDRQFARECLEKVGLQDFADRQISELSGGQQQRAFLARALAQDADVYLLDEPLSGVDHASQQIILTLMQTMQKQGKTIVMVGHDLSNVERYFDWVVLLNIRLFGVGPIQQLFTRELVSKVYGKDLLIFDEAYKLASRKEGGPLVP